MNMDVQDRQDGSGQGAVAKSCSSCLSMSGKPLGPSGSLESGRQLHWPAEKCYNEASLVMRPLPATAGRLTREASVT